MTSSLPFSLLLRILCVASLFSCSVAKADLRDTSAVEQTGATRLSQANFVKQHQIRTLRFHHRADADQNTFVARHEYLQGTGTAAPARVAALDGFNANRYARCIDVRLTQSDLTTSWSDIQVEFDLDEDNRISRPEIARFARQHALANFAEYDADGNSFLNSAELRVASRTARRLAIQGR